jgi:hypothetical protein
LRGHGKVVPVGGGVRVQGDVGCSSRRTVRRVYDAAVEKALRGIWATLDFLCGKRLVAILPEVIEILEKHGEIELDRGTRGKLLKISAATIDRLLAPASKRMELALTRSSGRSPSNDSTSRVTLRLVNHLQEVHRARAVGIEM